MNELRENRNKLKLSQEKMASKIGVTLSYYAQVEQGRVQAGVGFIRKYLMAFPETCTNIFFTGGEANEDNSHNQASGS